MAGEVFGSQVGQHMGVMLSEGAANFAGKAIAAPERELDRSQEIRKAEDVGTEELVDMSRSGKLAAEVFRPFFSKLAGIGIFVGSQLNQSKEREGLVKDFAEREGLLEDTVKLTDNVLVAEIKRLRGKNHEQGAGTGRGWQAEAELLSLLKEYSLVFSQYVATAEPPALAGKLKELRAKLLQKGVSEGKLALLEAKLKSGQKTDFGDLIKESLMLEMMAETTIEKTIRKKGTQSLLEQISPKDRMAVLETAREKASGELRGFVVEEIENLLIKKTFLQDNDFREAFKLLAAGEKTGLDYNAWLSDIWPKKKDDHGLYLLDVPHAATGMNVDTSTDNPNNQAPKHGFEYEQQDESELMINRLRALYMQRAFKGDAATHLLTEFKIRKLKNGLFKLGVMTRDLESQVKHEAEVVAKVKLIEMLKEALIERATFYELAGPAHELVERKVKGLIKNTERLGMPISTEEFNLMRDNANRRVFDISKRELDELRVKRSANNSPKLDQKEKHLVKLLKRLGEESQIEGANASFS